jgi:predicted transcriptional regulator
MGAEFLSPRVRKLIAAEMSGGRYRSESALLVDALRLLADRRAAIDGIERGLADLKVGRVRLRQELRRRLIKRHPELARKP